MKADAFMASLPREINFVNGNWLLAGLVQGRAILAPIGNCVFRKMNFRDLCPFRRGAVSARDLPLSRVEP